MRLQPTAKPSYLGDVRVGILFPLDALEEFALDQSIDSLYK